MDLSPRTILISSMEIFRSSLGSLQASVFKIAALLVCMAHLSQGSCAQEEARKLQRSVPIVQCLCAQYLLRPSQAMDRCPVRLHKSWRKQSLRPLIQALG